jgi:hypothetical protein
MDTPDFIEVFPDALAPDACAALVARFEASGQAQPGLTVAGHNPAHKDSSDLTITGRPEWADADAMLNRAMFGGLLRYLRKYPQVLLSTFAMQDRDGPEADAPLRLMRPDDFARYDDRTLTDLARNVLRPGIINLQYYQADRGGYPAWHCEIALADPRAEFLHRALLWTIYLNEDFEEGETEFLFQGRKIRPRTGSLLIAPTAFTHTHRGNRPIGGDKYIATSWVLFKRYEHFPRPGQ